MNSRTDASKARAQANARIANLMRSAHALLDRHVEANRPADIACKRGCAACCRQLVLTNRREASYIVTRFRGLVKDRLEQMHKQGTRFFKACASAHAGGTSINASSQKGRDVLGVLWWKLNHPCVFLTADNECGIYDARPMVCRLYHVTSDPRHCASEEADPECQIWQPPQMGPVPNEKAWDGATDHIGSLPTMLLQAWENRS